MVQDNSPEADAIISRALKDYAQQDQDSSMEHPTADALVEYQEGFLASNEAAAIHAHLEECPECAGDLERLGHWDPAEPPDEEFQLSAEELAEQRQRFELRVASKASLAPELPKIAPNKSMGSSWRFPLPLAATLILGALGLGFWLGTLQNFPQAKDQGLAVENLLFHTLSGQEGDLERSSGEQVEVAPEFDAIALRLLTADLTPYEEYVAELVAEDGAVTKRWADLARQPNGTFLLVIPKEGLGAGNYEVVLLGRAGREEAVISTFSFLLVPNTREL